MLKYIVVGLVMGVASVTVEQQVPDGVATIPSSGGTVTLADVASITFPTGSFAEEHLVTMSTVTLSPRSVFDQIAMAGSAGAVARTSYAVRVLTDEMHPVCSLRFEAPSAAR